MKRGIEDWPKAFEAGFKNAIIAKVAPTPEQDPEFSPEDVRHSVIRWLPSTIENASGPHISDPRTGEILNADIQFYHNVMNLQRDWYFVQAGPLDPKFAPPAGGATGVVRVVGEQLDPFLTPPDQLGTCWPDYTIRP